MIGFIGISTTYIFGTLLTANGSIKQLNIMAAFGMIINIILNLIFIPRFAALGAAWVSLLTQLLTALAQLIIAVRIFNLRVNYLLILKLTGFLLFSILAAQISHLIDNWLVGLGLFIVSGLTYAMLVRLINFKAFLQIIKNEEG